ncbi:olfactory receptor 2D3-like [Dendropsophus ebraccatus]|uniref:olfactory receptor 2D3-like n=1 Tax=Dendropsophus ebraccatus TaxID=150705 RepID=UPI0038321AF3
MAWNNVSLVTEFILLGLTDNYLLQIIFFILFLIIYLMILSGNFLIILVTITDISLHNPMYFFLANLSFLDICYSSSIIPRMLRDFLSFRKNISMAECVTQMYCSLGLGETECILLAVMAYDRYIAICYPLHYTSIIRKSVCIKVASGTWICGFLLAIPSVAVVWSLDRCGRNVINHFECEIPELLSLACDSIATMELINYTIGTTVLIVPVIFIISSYVKIIRSILRIASSTGRQKAFSTCGSHIMVVTVFYGSAMVSYLKPRSLATAGTDKLLAVFYSAITPMLNPLIYTLRNKEVKSALIKVTRNVI